MAAHEMWPWNTREREGTTVKGRPATLDPMFGNLIDSETDGRPRLETNAPRCKGREERKKEESDTQTRGRRVQ